MCERARFVGRRGGRPVVSGAAALPELLAVEGAAAGAAPGEAGAVRSGGANTVSRWGGSRRPLRCAVGTNQETLLRRMTEKASTHSKNYQSKTKQKIKTTKCHGYLS